MRLPRAAAQHADTRGTFLPRAGQQGREAAEGAAAGCPRRHALGPPLPALSRAAGGSAGDTATGRPRRPARAGERPLGPGPPAYAPAGPPGLPRGRGEPGPPSLPGDAGLPCWRGQPRAPSSAAGSGDSWGKRCPSSALTGKVSGTDPDSPLQKRAGRLWVGSKTSQPASQQTSPVKNKVSGGQEG